MVWLISAAVLALAALAELASPGPNRGLILASRYGWGPLVLTALVTAAVAVWVVFPDQRANVASLALLGLFVAGWTGRQYHWLRRMALRGRWPSLTRSCGLARLDRRGESWPFDATTTVTGAVRVEWLPVISRPRRVPGVGVRFRLTPARGGSISDVAEAAEALAAGLRVQRVEVTRTSPARGSLLAVWS